MQKAIIKNGKGKNEMVQPHDRPDRVPAQSRWKQLKLKNCIPQTTQMIIVNVVGTQAQARWMDGCDEIKIYTTVVS